MKDMKRQIITKISSLLFLVAAVVFAACDSYLDDVPKGQKIPQTWEDYNAFIRNNFSYHYFDPDPLAVLVGDMFKVPSTVTSQSLTRANYYADETVNRIDVMSGNDKNPYYNAYEGLFAWNLIVENVPDATECTEAQRRQLIAQARVLRAMHYFYLTNFYADQYSEATKDKLSVPMVTSASVEAPSPQVTLQKMYEFMLDDLNKAAGEDLPVHAETILHPNRALGYGMLARVYLAMGDYDNALKNASLALEQNDKLFNWVEFYQADKERYDNPQNYKTGVASNPETDNVENYIYGYGSSTSGWSGLSNVSYAISPERAARFEPGDARLLTHWKLRVSASGIHYYAGIYALEQNKGGMRSPEMYYIKAECLARKGGAENIKKAMDLVNKVRKTRILPEYYKDWTATTTKEAVEKIIRDKESEYIQTQVIFCDYRRLNQDPEYARAFPRVIEGKTYTLNPQSHLWIMPFPLEAISNPGNGEIKQNVDK
jgi:tetratricopeptide (TPR) repeat protein